MPETTPIGTPLLNDDGSASMATMLMSSHHAFRRDIALFALTLRSPAASSPERAQALRDEWAKFHASLHGHHEVEDQHMFPGLKAQNPALGPVIERLEAEHRRIDPLLAEGDRAFAALPASAGAAADVVAELSALLDAHLAFEEAHVVPLLRTQRQFPPPGSDAEAEMYALGFSWSLHGLAPEVVERILPLLPEILTSKLPAARAAFAARCERVWGSAKTGASRTSVPDWITA
jgi:hemerythrin-like domain-containing protein